MKGCSDLHSPSPLKLISLARRFFFRQSTANARAAHEAEELATRTQAIALARLLANANQALTYLPRDLEKRVLAISDALEQLPGASRRLVAASEGYLENASGRSAKDTLFPPILAFIEPAVNFLRECSNRVSILTSSLQSVSEQIDTVLSDEEHTYTQMAQLRFIRPMIRIEASRFEPEIQQSVLSLGNQIEVFTNNLGEALCCKFGVLRDAQAVIAETAAGLSTGSVQIAATARTQHNRITSLIKEFREGLEENANKDIRLTSIAVEISRLVSRMVVSLQSQDIVSQRLSHLLDGLNQLHQILSTGSTDQAFQLARIAAAQLTSIKQQVQTTERELRESIAAIDDLLERLDRSCLELPEFKVKVGGDNGISAILLTTMEHFRTAVTEVVGQVHQWSLAITPLGNNAARATALMRGISVEIRVIALNSQINSSNVDGGEALEVLASHVARVAMNATESAQTSAGESDRLVQRLTQIVADFCAFHEAGCAIAGEIEAGQEEQSRPLISLSDKASLERESVVQLMQTMGALLRQMEPNLELFALIAPAIDSAESVLKECDAFLASQRTDSTATLDKTESNWAATYTMEDERRVHQAALASVLSSERNGIESAKSSADSELFFTDGDTTLTSHCASATRNPTELVPPNSESNLEFF